MEKKTYTIGGRELSPAVITARLLKHVNKTLREAVQATAIDAGENDNPMLLYAVLWASLVEAEKVPQFLSQILVTNDEVWSEESAAAIEQLIASCPFDEQANLYTAASTDFFAGNPSSTRNIFLSLAGFIKNSDRLLKAWHRSLEDASQVRSPSTPSPSQSSTAPM